MKAEIRVPSVGESILEGILVDWLAEDRATVAAGAPLFELETDKVTLTVEAEQAGRLTRGASAGATVAVGAVVGWIETEAGAGAPRQTADGNGPVASPAARAILAEHRLDPAAVPGTGKGGRITREDAVAAVAAAIPAAPGAPAAPEAPAETAAAPALQTRRPMSPLRQRIAERLVLAQQTAAMLTTFNEVDLSALDALRKRVQERFTAAHGVKLGYMSFFVKAVAAALRTVPDLGARLEGGEIVADNTFDIGVAVSTERGLVVPVLRAVHRKGFGELERDMAGLAEQARTGRLTLDQLAGGVFTISNGGVFGSLLSTPILNHPQTGILGMHAIKRRPVAVGEEVVIRPMMYLALSYDHRVVDGREAVTFLKRIVTCLEDPEPMLMEACDGRG